jgi:hypothetical protein
MCYDSSMKFSHYARSRESVIALRFAGGIRVRSVANKHHQAGSLSRLKDCNHYPKSG